MAKVTIAGEAVIITSKFTLEDLKFVKRYRPDALILLDEEKNPYFGVNVCNGSYGKINKYGAEFATESRDGKKRATITMVSCDFGDGDVKELIADKIGSAIVNLNKVEDGLEDVIKEVRAERETVMNGIEIIGEAEEPTRAEYSEQA